MKQLCSGPSVTWMWSNPVVTLLFQCYQHLCSTLYMRPHSFSWCIFLSNFCEAILFSLPSILPMVLTLSYFFAIQPLFLQKHSHRTLFLELLYFNEPSHFTWLFKLVTINVISMPSTPNTEFQTQLWLGLQTPAYSFVDLTYPCGCLLGNSKLTVPKGTPNSPPPKRLLF